ncbi:MAG TPA: hypothetical protein VHY57_06925, partial [Rhizomicrobium sp.]|nr:hypothetical protein [Rhizomicrobium sp.]
MLGAFGVAVALETVAIVAVAAWIGSPPTPPAVKPAPLKVSLVTLPPTPPPATLVPPPAQAPK